MDNPVPSVRLVNKDCKAKKGNLEKKDKRVTSACLAIQVLQVLLEKQVNLEHKAKKVHQAMKDRKELLAKR